jgi:hypothetical protein
MRRDRRTSSIRVALCGLLLAGCTGSVGNATPPTAGAQGVGVIIRPDQITVSPNTLVPFAATVTGTANTSVAWSVDEAGGGVVDANGSYTAPLSSGTFHVTATSNADTAKLAKATVTVTASPPPVAVAVAPANGAVNACQTLQFTATVTGTTNTAVTWSVQEGAAGGTISSNGLYTAPSGPGVYHVSAVSTADPAKSSVASVTVSEVVLSVVVTPQQVTLSTGGTAPFTATVTNTCGSFTAALTETTCAAGRLSVK